MIKTVSIDVCDGFCIVDLAMVDGKKAKAVCILKDESMEVLIDTDECIDIEALEPVIKNIAGSAFNYGLE